MGCTLISGQQSLGSASCARNQLGIRATLESQCPAARCLWGVIPHCPKFKRHGQRNLWTERIGKCHMAIGNLFGPTKDMFVFLTSKFWWGGTAAQSGPKPHTSHTQRLGTESATIATGNFPSGQLAASDQRLTSGQFGLFSVFRGSPPLIIDGSGIQWSWENHRCLVGDLPLPGSQVSTLT